MASRRKKSKTLSVEELDFSLSNSAFLAFATSYTVVQMAARMNELYGWNLERLSDLQLWGLRSSIPTWCSILMYNDSSTHLIYMLIDNPLASGGIDDTLKYFDKILIITGQNAFIEQSRLYNDFVFSTERTVEESDILGKLFEQKRLDFLHSGIVETHYFDFRPHSDDNAAPFENEDSEEMTEWLNSPAPYANAGNLELFNKEQGRATTSSSSESKSYDMPRSSFLAGVGSGTKLDARRRNYMKDIQKLSGDMLSTVEQHLTYNNITSITEKEPCPLLW